MSVGGSGHMVVDVTLGALVQADELVQEVVDASVRIVFWAVEVSEGLNRSDRNTLDLFLEEIRLVQEEDQRSARKPAAVAHLVEQVQRLHLTGPHTCTTKEKRQYACRFLGNGVLLPSAVEVWAYHAVHGLVLEQRLVVFTQGSNENNSVHAIKAVNPLLALVALTTHVEHDVFMLVDDVGLLHDASSADTREQDVFVGWHIIRLRNYWDVLEKLFGGINDLFKQAHNYRREEKKNNVSRSFRPDVTRVEVGSERPITW